ncbi:MAG: N-acetylmuramoyl-L-alanine amidase-like domain-containing protein [Salinivenus sp.]
MAFSRSLPPFLLGALLVAAAQLWVGCNPSSDASPPASPDTVGLPDSVLTPPDAATARRFADVMQHGMEQRAETESIGALMQTLGTQFTDAPYLEGTLDEPPTERLVVRLDGFDCVTFIETTLAMARGVAANDTTYAGFAQRLAEQRYRNGQLQGYCSRLHYFTEWLADNEDRGLVDRLDDDLGSRSLTDTLDFMSTHRSDYDRFATNDSLYACIQDMEASLQARQQQDPVRYVPQDSIRAVYDELQAGDIVAMVTSIDGLDVSHSGLVYAHDDGGRGLLHASLSDGIVVSPDLQRYVQTNDNQIGIVVARPQSGP